MPSTAQEPAPAVAQEPAPPVAHDPLPKTAPKAKAKRARKSNPCPVHQDWTHSTIVAYWSRNHVGLKLKATGQQACNVCNVFCSMVDTVLGECMLAFGNRSSP